jgi:hypothetical protein
MGFFKNLEIEIREMDFNGMPVQAIANQVGLSIKQVLEILDTEHDEDPQEYAETAADLDADYYGRM